MALTPDSEKSREQQLAEQQRREQEVLLREVDEAVRQDELGGIAQRYGKLIAGGVVLALLTLGKLLFAGLFGIGSQGHRASFWVSLTGWRGV